MTTGMTTIIQNIKTGNLKEEARQLRRTAKKIGATKESARRFLISTGIYTASGQISHNFR